MTTLYEDDLTLERLEIEVLGSVINSPEGLRQSFLTNLSPAAFTGWRGVLAEVVAERLEAGDPVDPTALMHHLVTNNLAGRCPTHHLATVYGNWQPDGLDRINALSSHYMRRDLEAALTRGMQRSYNPIDAVQYVAEEMKRMERGFTKAMHEYIPTAAQFLAETDTDVDWCIPHLLPAETSMVITAEEGFGKSVFMRQLAVAAAFGVDPFAPWEHNRNYAPKRALVVDVENSETQSRAKLRNVVRYLTQKPTGSQGGLENLFIKNDRDLDLARPADRVRLRTWVRDYKAELLVIGPISQMVTLDGNEEESIRVWTRVMDEIMKEGCSVVIEGHAGNETNGMKRNLRPRGSSALRGWAGQGYGLRSTPCEVHTELACRDCGRHAHIEAWRGARDEVEWPRNLIGSTSNGYWWSRYEPVKP